MSLQKNHFNDECGDIIIENFIIKRSSLRCTPDKDDKLLKICIARLINKKKSYLISKFSLIYLISFTTYSFSILFKV